MRLRLVLCFFCLTFIFVGCEEEPEMSAPTEEPSEQVEQEEEKDKEEESETVDTVTIEEAEEPEDGLSPEVMFSGTMTLTETEIEVDVTSNLPEDVKVSVYAYSEPYGGYVVSQVIIGEDLYTGENGEIIGSVPFDESFFESKLNEPIEIELRFNPATIYFDDREEEFNEVYGEEGEHLEGPFVIENFKGYDDEPSYVISASTFGSAAIGEEFVIETPVFKEPPADQGDLEIWMEAEIVDIDHRYIHVEGSSNLLEGIALFGKPYDDEDDWLGQGTFSYDSETRRDGTFTFKIEYQSLTDEGFVRIHSQAGSSHRRGRAIQDVYGEEFEHIGGDVVKQRYDGKTEQMIELILPLNPEVEDAPDSIDVTRDGEEMKLIMQDDILFEFGKSDITKDGELVIEELAVWLEKEAYSGSIRVYGHTDNVGDDSVNQPLSEDRAENVYNLLQSNLKDPEIYEFEVEGFGKYEPIATNETDEGRERNRRVEILLQHKPSDSD